MSAPQHDWVQSTLGHGETMCSRCKITNREAAVLGEMNECSVPPPAPSVDNDNEPYSFEDFESDNDPCWNCGGEGFVSNCFEEFACIDPESGCDLCTRPCPECSR